MADPTYVRGITGRDYQTDSKEHAANYADAGGKVETKKQAETGVAAARDLDRVEEMGTIAKAMAGVGSGVSLGLGPAAMVKLGLVEPGMVEALETSGAYQAGDFAGMVAPAILSGGESTIAKAMASTPAGLMGRMGGAAEALAGRLMPEAAVMGNIARPTIQMAARGATEGAIVNMSHTASNAMIQDKPLTWSSIAASGVDGALMGGLVGGAAGAAGGLLGRIGSRGATEASELSTDALESKSGQVAKYLGASKKQLVSMLDDGGTSSYVKKFGEVLDGSIAQSPRQVLKAAQRSAADAAEVQASILRTLDKEASNLAPIPADVTSSVMQDVKAAFSGTKQSGEAMSIASKISGDLGQVRTWDNWAKTRAQLAMESESATGVVKQVTKTTMDVVDLEMKLAMERAAESVGQKGLADAYAGAVVNKRMAEMLGEMTTGKLASEVGKSNPLSLNHEDAKTIGFGVLSGHPLGAAGLLAGSKLVKEAQRRVEPFLAESAYRSAFGSTAAATTARVGDRMTRTMSTFMRGGRQAATTAAAGQAAPKLKYDMASYQKSFDETSRLLDAGHAAKVEALSQEIAEMGHPEMAKEVMDQFMRAALYMKYNMPPSAKLKQSGKLGEMPKPFGLGTAEQKFIRIQRAVRNPLSLLDDLEDGSLSRDAVKAVKYVYPAIHNELVIRAGQEMMAVKAEGKFVPADKVAMLGCVLDAPVDSKLESGFIDEIQKALVANRQPVDAKQSNAGKPDVTDVSAYQTPTEASA